MFYYVDCGVEFTNEFGDIDENFYLSIENQYQKVLELIHKEALQDKYKVRAFEIEKNSEYIGWGFHDYISEVFYQYYQ